MDAQLKKGVLDMCILKIIKKNDSMYGYTIMKEINELFPEVSESTIYTILRRLKKAEYLDITLKESTEGPQRKYYQLTKTGEDLLEKQLKDWKELIDILSKLDI